MIISVSINIGLITPIPSAALASRDQKIPDQPVTRSSRSLKVSHDCVQRLAHEKFHERGKNRDFDSAENTPGQKSYKMLPSHWNVYYSITCSLFLCYVMSLFWSALDFASTPSCVAATLAEYTGWSRNDKDNVKTQN